MICTDCSNKFLGYHPKAGETRCFKCIQLSDAGDDEIKVAAIQKKTQCKSCSLVYLRLTGDVCAPCREPADGDIPQTPKRNRVENKSGVPPPRGPTLKSTKAKSYSPPHHEILLLDSSDDDDQVKVFNDRVNVKREEVKTRRLTEKEPNGLPLKTQDYLAKKAKSSRTTSSGLAGIAIQTTPRLLGHNGQKVGTRVPSELRGYQPDENFGDVLTRIVNQFNEEKDGLQSNWLKEFPGKPVKKDNVIWTFKLNDSSIKPTFLRKTLGHFFDVHAAKPGLYMKKSEIASRLLAIVMQVPIEDTQTDNNYSDDDCETPPRLKRKLKGSGGEKKRIKVKQEASENSVSSATVKEELMEESQLREEKPLKISLTRPITFTRMTASDDATFVELPECHGTINVFATDATRTNLDLPRRRFRLVVQGETYNAYRYELEVQRFDKAAELQSLQSLLLQQNFLSSTLELFVAKLHAEGCKYVPNNVYVPETFLALLGGQDIEYSDMYFCQLASESEHDILACPPDFLEALSHFSLELTSGDRLIVDMQCCEVADRIAIHGGCVHTTTGDSSFSDEGKNGMVAFDAHHTCDAIFCSPIVHG